MNAWVCDWCHIVVANGELDPNRAPEPMSLLPGLWYSAGHHPDDECNDCNPDEGQWCDICDRESSPSWTCEGCGDQPGMFFDMHLIEKVTRTNPALTEALNKYTTCFTDVIDVLNIRAETYYDGRPALAALLVWDEAGMEYPEEEILSTNVPTVHVPEGHVVIKDYSEHEGLARALEAANVVTRVKPVVIGFGSGWLVKINEETVG